MIRGHQLAALVVAGVLVIAGAAAPAAANPVGDVLGDGEDDGIVPDVASIKAGITGTTDRISAWASRVANGPPSAEEKANATASTFNNNSGAIVEYVNERATVDSNHEVAEITFSLGDEEATRYLVGEVDTSTGNYTSAAMLTPAEYESRGLDGSDVDETVALSGYAAENAPNEIESFLDGYVSPNDDIGGSPDMARMTGAYAGSVEASFEW